MRGDIIKITNPGIETRSAFGVTKDNQTSIEVRGYLKSVNAVVERSYQYRGYEKIEYQVVIFADPLAMPRSTVQFSGDIEIQDLRTGETRYFDIATPAELKGKYIMFGVIEKDGPKYPL